MFPIRDTLPRRHTPVATIAIIGVNAAVFFIELSLPPETLEKVFCYAPEKAEELAALLSTGTWTHDYPLTFERSRELGLRVSSDIPTIFMDLIGLYPQPVRRQPTVEYLPGPRRRDVAESGERK
jgi:hypothetical protein